MSRPTRRRALLIGNERYDDGRFAPLPSVRADIWQLQQVLEHRNIGAFLSVRAVPDLTADDMRYEISEFLESRDEDELALLYVSGHGTRLVREGGEFHFIAKDTDFGDVAKTGVSAGFVNDLLEQCVAPQKIVMIDCCRSGGFAVGLRTSDPSPRPAAKSGEEAPLTSRGVYVLSSSRAGQDSYAGAGDADGVAPSAFTAEVVEALRTGRVGKDRTSDVSVTDLFDYVNRQMRSKGAMQIPVASALGVDDRIVIAHCPLGAAPQLVPLSRKPAPASEAPVPPAGSSKAARSQPAWADLLTYYKDCVRSDVAEPSLLRVNDAGTSYVCLPGTERFLSGDLPDDLSVPVPPHAADLVQDAVKKESELWAGYPAVVMHGQAGTRHQGTARFAPLLIRAIEVIEDGDGVRLKPYGPVIPHPGLAKERLGAEEAAALADSYSPTWHARQHDRMAVDVRHLLNDEFELPCVQEPRPDRLEDQIDVHTPADGARNAAVLFAVPRSQSATAKLLKDLDAITRKAAQIKTTALAALSPDPAERAEPGPERRPGDVRLVTPLACNEAQSAILLSAMTRRLTVATGPPGTGKSQLVANLVATALADGQRVLVASTNNEAVDEVHRRCERLAEGSVVRTGSVKHRQTEANTLEALKALAPPGHNVETAGAQLGVTAEDLLAARRELARTAMTERDLRHAGQAREDHAADLDLPLDELIRILNDHGPPDVLASRAERTASAGFLGEWRRRRFLRRLGIPAPAGTAEACLSLAGAAHAEATWRTSRPRVADGPDDDGLVMAFEQAEEGVRRASAALLDSTVRSSARRGRGAITALLAAQNRGGSDWAALREALATVRGWAVTSLSARRFPDDPALFDLVIIDEASQCAIPHVLPLLFRARRALIIGDVMQLPHIALIDAAREGVIRREQGLRSEWLEKHRLGFRRHSAFHAAERAAGGSLLLDEHFRCHPDIAAFVNERFYEGRLNILTDVRPRPSLPRHSAIVWSRVEGRAERYGGSWINRAEVEKVLESIRYLLRELPEEATIGVVTPFKAQVEAVQRRLGQEHQRVRVGTVHTFQGGERDVMLFSLVAAQGMRQGTIRWVEKQTNLWNVAITRARSHLIVVGDSDLWRRRGGLGAALLAAAGTSGDTGDSGKETWGNGVDDSGELIKRLYRSLSIRYPDATVELGTTANGHRADVLIKGSEHVAVLLDRGFEHDAEAARHLRLMLRRRALLDTATDGPRGLRLPAWKLHDTQAVTLQNSSYRR
ncbi:AAA family ATPase [Actinomadura sp. DSM 109109]|nr:AAA family ATPase [Actinomadura lepetitiana]